MSEPAPDVAGRLEEIDRRLREIQAELLPGRVPRETRVPVTPQGEDGASEPDHAPEPVPDQDQEPEPGPSLDARRRGRSGPLAEALERARDARLAGLTAAREPDPDEVRGRGPEAGREAQPPPAPRPRPQHPPHRQDEPARARPDPPGQPASAVSSGLRHATSSSPRLEVLAELQSSLLAATRDLLEGYERASFSASDRPENRVTMSAGPFSSTEALRVFERELARIPGVRDVGVRGYEGARRAIIEVELDTREH